MRIGEDVAKARIARFLRSRAKVRVHGAFLVFVSCLVAWLCSWAMLRASMNSMSLRYFLTVACGYTVFLSLVKFWVRLWKASSYVNQVSQELKGGAAKSGDLEAIRDTGADFPGIDGLGGMDGEGCLLLIVCLLVFVALFSTVGYGIFSAEMYFADIVFETLLTAGLVVSARRRGTGNWENAAVRSSLPRVVVLLVAAEIFAWVATSVYPGATTAGDVWRRYWLTH